MVPNTLSIQHPRRSPSHHLRYSKDLFTLLIVQQLTWLRRERERHTHSHRAPPLTDKNIYRCSIFNYLVAAQQLSSRLPPIIGRHGIQRYRFQFNNFAWISLGVLELFIEIVYLLLSPFLDLAIILNYSPLLIYGARVNVSVYPDDISRN